MKKILLTLILAVLMVSAAALPLTAEAAPKPDRFQLPFIYSLTGHFS